MVHDLYIPMCLLEEACNTNVYIINKFQRHNNKILLVRNHMDHTYVFFVFLCLFIFLRRRDRQIGYICWIK